MCSLLIALLLYATPAWAGSVTLDPAVEGIGRNTPVLNDVFNSIVGPVGMASLNTEIRPTGIPGFLNGDPFEERSVVEFPLAPLAGLNVTSATLVLDFNGEGNVPLVSFFQYAGNGNVELPDFSSGTKMLAAQVQLTGDPLVDRPLLKNIDVTAAVQSLLAAGASHAGFLSSVDVGSIGFFSLARFSGPSMFSPMLQVQFVPEPATGLASIVALLTLAILGRTRRKTSHASLLRAGPGAASTGAC